MNKLKVLELFGGIGACSKALERLGIDYEIADYVEIDKYAVKSFNAIHNTNFEPQDITQWDKDIEVDLVMHGSPCQDFSLAGLQAGGDKDSGTRSSLMYETLRIVEKLKPKYVIWENVKNLLSKKHRHNFDAYLESMEKLGYKNYYQVLNAKDYGIPQNRERVFTISIRNNDLIVRGSLQEHASIRNDGICPTLTSAMGMGGGQVPVIYKNSVNFIFPPKQELKLKLKDMLEDNVDEKYYLFDKMINYCMGVNQKESKFPRKERFLQSLDMTNNREIATTISTNAGNRPVDNFVIDKEKYRKINKSLQETLEKNEIQTLTTQNNLGVCVIGGIGEKKSNGGTQWYQQDRIYDNNIGLSLSTCANPYYPDKQLRIRKLTPMECWRLMGFDDEDFEKASKVNSNAQLYKQAGNSIVVNVLESILKNLLESKGE